MGSLNKLIDSYTKLLLSTGMPNTYRTSINLFIPESTSIQGTLANWADLILAEIGTNLSARWSK